MTSYKNECQEFTRHFSYFISRASRFLMHRKSESADSNLDHQMGGLLLGNIKKASPISERSAYRAFITLLEFIKESEYIIEYVPYSDITHIIYDDSSIDTHDDIQQLIVYFWSKYKIEKEKKDNTDRDESVQLDLDLDLDWEFDWFSEQGQAQRIERTIYKIVEHIKLAILQRSYSLQERNRSLSLIDREIKDKQEALNELENKIASFENSIDEKLKSNTLSMISVLGIFAAVLMGAFGAIQGFTSLFANAHTMDLSIILIISSIGASGVILILFFLLNGVAKLTGSSLSNSSKENGTLIEKHPALLISHGILILISLLGASLELSNINLRFAWQGLWWLIPLLWFVYLIIAMSTRKLFPSFDSYLSENDSVDKEPSPKEEGH